MNGASITNSADDAFAHGALQTEWRTNRNDLITDLRFIKNIGRQSGKCTARNLHGGYVVVNLVAENRIDSIRLLSR